VCVLSVITSVLFFALPLGGRCRACTNSDPEHCMDDGTKFRTFQGYHCGEGSYNDLAVLVFNPQVG
jgi:chloride channel 7